MKYIKQFGLHRSGTNVTKALIEKNFKDVRVFNNILGSKHKQVSLEIINQWAPDDLDSYGITLEMWNDIRARMANRQIPFIFNVRDPFSWTIRYHKYVNEKREHKNKPNLIFDNDWCEKQVKSWSVRVRSYLNFTASLPDNMFVIINFRDLIHDFGSILTIIEKKFEFFRKQKNLSDIFEGAVMRGTDTQIKIHPKKKFDRDYCIQEKWVNEYTDQSRNFIKMLVQKEVDNDRRLLKYVTVDSVEIS